MSAGPGQRSWPGWLPWLAAILVIAGCVRLSLWQLDRAAEKEALEAAREHAPAVALTGVTADTPRFARVSGRGRFDGSRQVLLDNQLSGGRPGVHVFTPLAAGDGLFLVNRGWTGMERGAQLPDPPAPEGTIEIRGVLDDPPEVGLRLGESDPLDSADWPNLVTYYDPEHLAGAFGPQLAGRIIRLAPDHPAHLTGEPWARMRFGPERHRAYAFQWALLALAVAVIAAGLGVRARIQRNKVG